MPVKSPTKSKNKARTELRSQTFEMRLLLPHPPDDAKFGGAECSDLASVSLCSSQLGAETCFPPIAGSQTEGFCLGTALLKLNLCVTCKEI